MIVYSDILARLSKAGWSAYRLAKEHVLSPSILDRLRTGKPITISTLDIICRLCDCQPGDILSYIPDPEEGRE